MKCFFFKQKNSKSEDFELNRKSKKKNNRRRSVQELYKEKQHNFRVFTLRELVNATNGFNGMLKIGEGGFGKVYRGTIISGKGDPIVVAIKKLNTRGFQGHKEWLAEVQFLSIVSHPNLVKLLGYCSVDGERGIQRLLVYEFMPNRSLEDHLFSRGSLPPLPWKTRLQIMLGAAQGLQYLHQGLEEIQVIYRDFKSSNVLLDTKFQPKLSDFGLAREGPTGDQTHVSTAVVGTQGYAAPEYVQTGHLRSKSDIWSFGVVLYEVLTGRRTVERSLPTEEQKLIEWIKNYPVDSDRFSTIIDPRLTNQYSLDAARKIAKLADSCLKKKCEDRPPMSQIVEGLEQALQCSEASNFTTNLTSQSPRPKLGRKR